jgi:hypothetical protein
MRAGFFMFFFLLPLGLCAAVFGTAAAWKCFCLAVIGNAALSAGLSMYYNVGFAAAGLEILYFTVLTLGFTWIMAGNPLKSSGIFSPRTVFRFIAASLAGALAFLGLIFIANKNEGFYAYIRSVAETVSSMYISAAGADAVQQSLLENLLTPDKIIQSIFDIALKGGALISVIIMFFFNRQAAYVFARLFPRRRGGTLKGGTPYEGRGLAGFHAPGKTIWVLSFCLAGILIFRLLRLSALEIIAWNILVVCAVMFLAQGGGIVLFTLTRRSAQGSFRILFGVLIFFIILSPGINVIALGLLILLGIAENWLPLRVIKMMPK